MLINKYDYLLDNSIESILEYKNTRFSGINTNVYTFFCNTIIINFFILLYYHLFFFFNINEI